MFLNLYISRNFLIFSIFIYFFKFQEFSDNFNEEETTDMLNLAYIESHGQKWFTGMEREIISPRKGEGKLHLHDYITTIKSIILISTRSQQNITLWACGHWAYLWTMGVSLNYKLSSDNNNLREPKKEKLKYILTISQHEKFLIAVVPWQFVWPVDWIGGILISLDWY